MVIRVATFALSDQMVAGALRTQTTMANLQVQESSGLKSRVLGGYGPTPSTSSISRSRSRARSPISMPPRSPTARSR